MKQENSTVKLDFSLEESELKTYFYSITENKLIIKIGLWNERIATFSFLDPVYHVDRFRNGIINLCIISEKSDLLETTLNLVYESPPKDYPYRLYQFKDSDNFPCIEIICSQFEYEVTPNF